jgi:hypothetical protein
MKCLKQKIYGAKIMDNESFQKQYIENIRNNKLSDEIEAQILPVGKLNKSKVVNVYHRDYIARLTEALGETFETIWAVIGDEDYFQLAKDYITKYPSDCEELGQYGHHMETFLKGHSLTDDYSFLPELASFEFNYWKTFHKPKEHSNLDYSTLSSEKLLSSKFSLPTNLTFYSWDSPLHSIWNMRKIGLAEFDEDLDTEQKVIIFKTDSAVTIVQLTSNQFHILKQMNQGQCLAEILGSYDISEHEIQSLFKIISVNKLLSI